MVQHFKYLSKVQETYLLGAIFNIINLIIIFYSSFYGLDLSDESFYFLGYCYSSNNFGLKPWLFHLAYNSLFSNFNFNLLEVRLLRFTITIISTIVIFFALNIALKPKKLKEKIFLFNILLSAMLLGYCIGPLAISYNTMSSIFLVLVSGIWLLSKYKRKNKLSFIYFILIGFFLVLGIYSKLTVVIVLLYIIFFEYNRFKFNMYTKTYYVRSLINIISFAVGGLFAMLLMSKSIHGVVSLSTRLLSDTFQMSNTESHSFNRLFSVYFENIKDVFWSLKLYLIALFIAFFLKKKNGNTKPFFITISTLILLDILIRKQYWFHGESKLFFINIYIIIFLLILLFKNRSSTNLSMFFLGLVPVLVSAGTQNPLSSQILFYAIFYFLIIYLCSIELKSKKWTYILLNITILISTIQTISSLVIHPYRKATISNCQYKIKDNERLNNLYVDSRTKNLKDKLSFLDTLKQGQIYTYASLSGIALLINKPPISLDWLEQKTIEKSCEALANPNLDPKKIIFLIPEDQPIKKEVIKCMTDRNIQFKKNYKIVKKINYFDFSQNKENNLFVYLYN